MTALTIGRKSAAMVTALVAIGLVVVILWQVQQQKSLLTESVSKNYRIVVELLAGQLSGAFRWNKPEAIEKAFESLQLVDAEALTAIYAKDVQGSALFSATIPGFDATTTGYGEFVARLQAPEAISLHQLNDLLLVSTPIFSGKENAYVGSLTLTWNLAALNQQIHDAAGLQFGIGLAVLLIVAVAVIFLLQKLVGSPIAEASRIAGEIARGNLNNTFSFASRDEVGLLGASLHQMQQELVGRLERDARSAAEMLRLKEALDNASSSIVVTSSDHRIIFVNQAARQLFERHQQAFQSIQASFTTATLIDLPATSLFPAAEQERLSFESLRQATTLEFVLKGSHFETVTTPVLSPNQQRAGTIIEWRDRTQQALIEKELRELIDAAKAGDLTRRADAQGRTGFFALFSQGINELLNTLETVIQEVNTALERMANGDLNCRIERAYSGTYDQLKSNLNLTIDNLGKILSEIEQSAHAISSGAAEILRGNQDLSSRTDQETAEVQRILDTIVTFRGLVQNNASSVVQTNEEAESTSAQAQSGKHTLDLAISAMEQINQASQKITEIIGVIDEIAFQTNLLALNASVEAARAGEHGRGFAVVAAEVRLLAQRSAHAAKEIKELISDSELKVKAGTALVNESGAGLDSMMARIRKLTALTHAIRDAISEQAGQVEEIKSRIDSIDETTQKNATLAEQISAASVSMEEKSAALFELTRFFSSRKSG